MFLSPFLGRVSCCLWPEGGGHREAVFWWRKPKVVPSFRSTQRPFLASLEVFPGAWAWLSPVHLHTRAHNGRHGEVDAVEVILGLAEWRNGTGSWVVDMEGRHGRDKSRFQKKWTTLAVNVVRATNDRMIQFVSHDTGTDKVFPVFKFDLLCQKMGSVRKEGLYMLCGLWSLYLTSNTISARSLGADHHA